MRKLFKRKMWMRVMAIVLAVALNLGALDGIIRYTVQELTLGSFAGFAQQAEAKNVQAEKNKNTLGQARVDGRPVRHDLV